MANKKTDGRNLGGKMTNWGKNFGKSVKYSGIDILKELAPNLYDTSQNAIDAAKLAAENVKESKVSRSKVLKQLESIPIVKWTIQGIKNAKQDALSGKFNNTDRLQRMVDKDLNDGFEDDFSFDSEEGEMDFEPSFEDEGSEEDNIDFSNPEEPNAAEIVEAGVESGVAKSVGKTLAETEKAVKHTSLSTGSLALGQTKGIKLTAEGFQSIAELLKQNNTTDITLRQKLHSENLEVLKTMNENVAKLVAFDDETLSKLSMGALQYFEDQLTVTRGILESVNRIAEKVAPIKEEEEEEEEKPQYSSLFTGRGIMKFSNYPEILKKNFMTAVDQDPILSQIKQVLTDEEAMIAIASNPLSFVTTRLVNELIPGMIKSSLKTLDNSIGAFFPALFGKLNTLKDSSNPLFELLGKIFGIDVVTQTEPEIANYEKGAVPFDGITHRTINVVIPEYLSGILAVLTGQEQKAYDYEYARFTTRHALDKQMQDESLRESTSGLGKVMSWFTTELDRNFAFTNKNERRDWIINMQNMFSDLAKRGVGFDGTKSSAEQGMDSGKFANIFDALFKAMPEDLALSFARGIFQSSENFDRYNKNFGENVARMINYLQTETANRSRSDVHLDRDADDDYKYTVRDLSPTKLSGKQFKSDNQLLYDIRKILYEGIIVFPRGSMSGESSDNDKIIDVNKRAENFEKEKKSWDDSQAEIAEWDSPHYLTKEEREKAESLGKTIVDNKNLKDKDVLVQSIQFNRSRDAKNIRAQEEKQKMGWFYDQIHKSATKRHFDSIKSGLETLVLGPSKMISSMIDKFNRTLYEIIYGDDSGQGIVKTTIEKVKQTFDNFGIWLKKKWEKVTDYLFGKDGITGTKAYKWLAEKGNNLADLLFGKKTGLNGAREGGAFSGAFNTINDMFLGVRAELFGTAYKDSLGVQHAQNTSSVFHSMRKGISDAVGQMQLYLFGEPEKDEKGNKKSFMDSMTDKLSIGFTNFSNFFFGSKMSEKDGKASFGAYSKEFEKNLPKALAFGIVGAGIATFMNFGLLGTLLLPGGPIGGAILGVATGFLSQSEKFKNFLFGNLDVNGKRMGGLISKKIQDWTIQHKTALVGGATFGAVKGILGATGVLNLLGPLGYMANYLLPGGPIAGALMGAAVGIGWKSQTFQKFLYGSIDKNGTKIGGILNTQYSKSMKKYLPNMAFGALSFGAAGTVIGQMGILGSMLTPFGPLGMAIIGAATGIVIASDKFKAYLFGKEDEKTGLRKAGLFNKLSNIFSLSIVEPFKIQLGRFTNEVQHWFTEKISSPFKAALKPLKLQFKLIGEDIHEMFSRGIKALTSTIDSVFEKAIGLPLARFMEERVLQPMRGFMKSLIGGFGKIFGAILSSPVKALSFIAAGVTTSLEERGLKESREERSEKFKEASSQLKDAISSGISSFFGIENKNTDKSTPSVSFGTALKNFFSAAISSASQYTSGQTEKDKKKYINREAIDAEIKKEQEEEKARYEARKAELDVRAKSNDIRLEEAKKANFDNVLYNQIGEVVADISKIYDMNVPLNDINLKTDETNSILGSIRDFASKIFRSQQESRLIEAAMAYHETGNSDFIDRVEDKPSTPIAENIKVPPSMKDSKIAEDIQEKTENEQLVAEEQVAEVKSVKEEKAKKEIVAGGKSKFHELMKGRKGQVTQEFIVELIDAIPKNATGKVKEFYESKVMKLINALNYQSKKTETVSTVAEEAKPEAVTAAIKHIKQEEPKKVVAEEAVQKKQVEEEKKTEAKSVRVEASASKEEREFDAKNKIRQGVDPALKYLRIIASNVDGQLNGVGSNVYKSRRLLESIAGVSSDDFTGSNNKDRVTLLGRAGRMLRMMLFHPIEFVADLVTKPFKVLFNIGHKIYDTAWNIVSGIGETLTSAANMVVDVGKKTVGLLFKIPGMAVDIISGIASVSKELLIDGIKIVSEGVIGLINSGFKIIGGAASAIGSIVKGVGKGIGELFFGLGKLSKGILSGVGKAISGTVSIIGQFGKTTLQVTGAVAEGLTKVFTSATSGIFKIANTLVSGVTDLISTVGSTLFSIATSPFRFIGKLANGMIMRSSHVIVDGGYLDRVKVIEKVERDLSVESQAVNNTSNWEKMKAFFSFSSQQSASTTKPEVEEFKKAKPEVLEEEPKQEEVKSEEKKEESKSEEVKSEEKKKTEQPKVAESVKKEEKKETPKVAEPVKPKTSNVTADMLRSGVVSGNGPVQRTAAVNKAVADAVAEKDLMQSNELKQTSLLEGILNKATERNSIFSKLFKFLGAGALLLWGWLKKIAAAFEIGSLLNKLKKTISDPLERLIKNISKSFSEGISKSITDTLKETFGSLRKGFGSAIERMFTPISSVIKDKFFNIAESIKTKFGSITEAILKKLGGSVAEGAASKGSQVVAGELAEGTVKIGQKLLTAPKNASVVAEASIKDIAAQRVGNISLEEFSKLTSSEINQKFFQGTAEENKAVYKLLAKRIHPDLVSAQTKDIANESFKTLGKAFETSKISSNDFGKQTVTGIKEASIKDSIVNKAKEWLKMGFDALKQIESFINSHLGKNIQFADKLWKVISKSATPQLLAANASKIAPAAAKAVASGTVGGFPIAAAIITTYNTISGLHDAAHYFRINSESVTTVMRICAAITKVVVGIPVLSWAIFTAILMVICAIAGVDLRSWLSQELYKILVDDKSIEQLEADQAKFIEEARAAGFIKTDVFGNEVVDIEKYNDEVNATVFQKVWNTTKSTFNDFKEWAAPKVESFKTYIAEKYDSAKELVISIPDKFNNFKNKIGETGRKVIEWSEEKYNTAYGWVFGVDDENGNHIPGILEDPSGIIYTGIKSTIAEALEPEAKEEETLKIFNRIESEGLSLESAKELSLHVLGTTGKKIGDSFHDFFSSIRNVFGGFISDTPEVEETKETVVFNPSNVISDGIDSLIASALSISKEDYLTGVKQYGPGLFITSKLINVPIEKLKESPTVQFVRDAWLSIFGGVDDKGNVKLNVLSRLSNWFDDVIERNRKEWETYTGRESFMKVFFLGRKDDPTWLGKGISEFSNWFDSVIERNKKEIEEYTGGESFIKVMFLGRKDKPNMIANAINTFGNFISTAAENFKTSFEKAIDSVVENLSSIPNLFTTALSSIGDSISSSFHYMWRRALQFVLGVELDDVKEEEESRKKIEKAKEESIKSIKPITYHTFSGSGERRSMSDSDLSSTKYGDSGTYGTSGCAPVMLENVTGIDAKKIGKYAESAGYKTSEGTSEGLIYDFADKIGMTALPVPDVSTGKKLQDAGFKIADAGYGEKYGFTDAGHYNNAIINDDLSVTQLNTRGKSYDTVIKPNDTDKISRMYAFSGFGKGEESKPEFDKIDVKSGDIIPKIGKAILDWIVVSPATTIGSVISSGISHIFGFEIKDSIVSILKSKLESKVSAVVEYFTGGIPSNVHLIYETAKSSIETLLGIPSKIVADYSIIGKIKSLADYGITRLNNWLFGNIPGGSLIVDLAKSSIGKLFGENDINKSILFANMISDVKKKISTLSNWIIGKIPNGSIIIDTLTRVIPEQLKSFVESMVNGMKTKWEEFKNKALDFSNINLKDLFINGIKTIANKMTGNGFVGSGMVESESDDLTPQIVDNRTINIELNEAYREKIKLIRERARMAKEQVEGSPFSGSGFNPDISKDFATGKDEYMDPEAPKLLPIYKQWDTRWADKSYGYNTMRASACGPTSMAMVGTWATGGKSLSPVTAAKWSEDHGYRKPGGTADDYFPAYARELGFELEPTKNADKIWNSVAASKPVISLQDKGKFTKNGHFIVVAGQRKDGSIIVYDPNNYYQNEKWTKDDIQSTWWNNWVPSGSNLPSKENLGSSSESSSDSSETPSLIDKMSAGISAAKSNWDERGFTGLLSAFAEGFSSGKSNKEPLDTSSPINPDKDVKQEKVVSKGKGKGLADATGKGYDYPNINDETGRGDRYGGTKGIVIHHLGLSNNQNLDVSPEYITENWHNGGIVNGQKKPAVCGYNFVIRQNGDINRGRRYDINNQAGAHTIHSEGAKYNFDNWNSLGIVLSGTFEGNNQPTQEQLDSTSHLVYDLATEFKIPIDRQHIIGHRETAGTDCPGTNLYDKMDSIVENAKKFNGSGFIGNGNIMSVRPQADGECTLESFKNIYRAYTGKEYDGYLSFSNWYSNFMSTLNPEELPFTQGERTEFESTVETKFNEHPDYPAYLYQTGGYGSKGSHPVNRGSGNHAVIIGRKLKNNKYEIYDSNQGIVHKLNLNQIFDSSAKGSADQGTAGQGNILWFPRVAPSAPITQWVGGDASGAVRSAYDNGPAVTAGSSNDTTSESTTTSDAIIADTSNISPVSDNSQGPPTSTLGLFNKYLNQLGVASRMALEGQVYTAEDWQNADKGVNVSNSNKSSSDSNFTKEDSNDENAKGKTIEGLPFSYEATKTAEIIGSKHPELPWAQMMLETGGPDNNPDYWGFKYHNYGGIKWYSSMGEDRKSPIYCPPGEAGGAVPYAKFTDGDDYSKYWVKFVLRHFEETGLYNAKTPLEWGKALHPDDGKGNYSALSGEEYAKRMSTHLNGKYKDKLSQLKGNGTGDEFEGNGFFQGLLSGIIKGATSELGKRILKSQVKKDKEKNKEVPETKTEEVKTEIPTKRKHGGIGGWIRGMIGTNERVPIEEPIKKINDMNYNELLEYSKTIKWDDIPEFNKPNWEEDTIGVIREKIKVISKPFKGNGFFLPIVGLVLRELLKFLIRRHGPRFARRIITWIYRNRISISKWIERVNQTIDKGQMIQELAEKFNPDDSSFDNEEVPEEVKEELNYKEDYSDYPRPDANINSLAGFMGNGINFGQLFGRWYERKTGKTTKGYNDIIEYKPSVQTPSFVEEPKIEEAKTETPTKRKYGGLKGLVMGMLGTNERVPIEEPKIEEAKPAKVNTGKRKHGGLRGFLAGILGVNERVQTVPENVKNINDMSYSDMKDYSKRINWEGVLSENIPDFEKDTVSVIRAKIKAATEMKGSGKYDKARERIEEEIVKYAYKYKTKANKQDISTKVSDIPVIESTKDESVPVVQQKEKSKKSKFSFGQLFGRWYERKTGKTTKGYNDIIEYKPTVQTPSFVEEPKIEEAKPTKVNTGKRKYGGLKGLVMGMLGTNERVQPVVQTKPIIKTEPPVAEDTKYGLDKLTEPGKTEQKYIDAVVNNLKLQFDNLGNVKNINIPDELRITDNDENDVKYSKQFKQIKGYFEFGGKTPEEKIIKAEPVKVDYEISTPAMAGKDTEEVHVGKIKEETNAIKEQTENSKNEAIWDKMVSILTQIAENTKGIDSGFNGLMNKEFSLKRESSFEGITYDNKKTINRRNTNYPNRLSNETEFSLRNPESSGELEIHEKIVRGGEFRR